MRYARQKNIRAFNLIYKRYRVLLFGFLVKWLGDRNKAEDIYQEVFIRIINTASRYKPRAKFKTWIFTIARNLLIDNARKQKTTPLERTSSDSNASGSKLDSAPTLTPDPEQAAHASEIQRIVLHTLQDMNHEQREMFLLREEAGLDFATASKIAACSVNTAKSRMRYALLKLRESLHNAGIRAEGSAG